MAVQRTTLLVESLLNLVFPPTCLGCGEAVSSEDQNLFLCGACESKISPIARSICEKCGAPSADGLVSDCRRCPRFETYYSHTRSAAAYTSPLRELIHEFKFRGSRRVRPLLIDLFLSGASRFLSPERFDVIVSVPLHWWRRFEREFNQAEILGRALAEEWGVPHCPHAARRIRLTRPQSRLPGAWREKNIQGAFEPGRQTVAGARVLLVDDVMTTGRTLAECASVLIKAGAESVVGYTLARRV